MEKVNYNRWATDVWSDKPFVFIAAVPDEQTVVTRQRSNDVSIQALEQGGTWQPLAYEIVADDVVPTINWVTVVAQQPLLVEITQSGISKLRLLLTVDAPVSTNEEGVIRRSNSQKSHMRVERTKVVLGCDTRQAKELKNAVRDKLSLLIFEFAAHLLKKCDNQAPAAQATVGELWRYPPKEIRSAIPSRFHCLAETDRHTKVYMDVVRCIDVMALWK